ncbi:MAG: glycosyltransferase family 4 protein [Burkholderiales bacterium]
MRLIIDARMLGHSGIGVYLTNVLRGVLQRCVELQPVMLVLPKERERALALSNDAAQVVSWAATPLSVGEFRMPPVATRHDIWWSPHFNVPLLSAVPLVVTLHDLLPLAPMEFGGAWHKRLAVRTWLRAIRARARRVICVSEFTRQEAIRVARLEPCRMDVIHLGVDRAWAPRAKTPASGATPYLLFVGLVKPHKNLLGLLRAFETIAPAVPHRLVVIGRQSGLREVDHAAIDLARRLAPRVELREDIAQTQLVERVAGADLLVQPSFHEGFGLPPLEAMAAGTPVLVARAGAMPEICGDAAQYCDPRSPADIARRIVELLGNPALRTRMRELGLARARTFTWERCAQATSEILLAAGKERA